MSGFFTKKETESISAMNGKIHSCASCGLYKDCHSPKMKPYGKFEKGIMVIGDYLDILDDEKGKPFQSKHGRMLKHTLKEQGIDLFNDCISLNATNCLPPLDREPNSTEIDHCRSVIVWKALKEYQPKVVILLGEAALASVIGYTWGGGTNMNRWRGFCIPDQSLKTWICPTYHPRYLHEIEMPKHYVKAWEDDLQNALDKVDIPFPRYSKPEIRYMKDSRFIEELSPVLSSFDYETTAIKPHAKGQRIVCTSIADREDRAWVFPTPKTKEGWQPFRRWLYNKDVPKMAHNLKFEDTWSKEILKVPVRGWEWDSMLAAHILDNRPGVSGLKFQTYVTFGIQDYSIEVGQYLKAGGDEDGANTKNAIMKLMKTKSGRKQVMEYCALDSVYQYRLAIKQMEALNYGFLPF